MLFCQTSSRVEKSDNSAVPLSWGLLRDQKNLARRLTVITTMAGSKVVFVLQALLGLLASSQLNLAALCHLQEDRRCTQNYRQSWTRNAFFWCPVTLSVSVYSTTRRCGICITSGRYYLLIRGVWGHDFYRPTQKKHEKVFFALQTKFLWKISEYEGSTSA